MEVITQSHKLSMSKEGKLLQKNIINGSKIELNLNILTLLPDSL
jgi:hypothetical protein